VSFKETSPGLSRPSHPAVINFGCQFETKHFIDQFGNRKGRIAVLRIPAKLYEIDANDVLCHKYLLQ
jgi:hypothetical protein